MLSKPMPSPRGTNHEGLYLSAGTPVAAYDAAMSNSAKKRVTDFLSGKLTDTDMQKIKALIAEEDGGDPDDDADQSDVAQDHAYRAKVKRQYDAGQITYEIYNESLARGRPMVTSAEGRQRFDERFPGALKIKLA